MWKQLDQVSQLNKWDERPQHAGTMYMSDQKLFKLFYESRNCLLRGTYRGVHETRWCYDLETFPYCWNLMMIWGELNRHLQIPLTNGQYGRALAVRLLPTWTKR